MRKIIFHIDFDSFFASVEQHANPALQNKPIGVTATNGRTCIIASSREAKRYGVKTAMRTYDALRLCPDIQFVPADFVKYWEVSKKFIAICKDFSPFVEVFSIDEVFMDVTQTATLFGGEEKLIQKMKKRFADEIGSFITVSIGVSHNKLLAKLASGLQKPNGLMRIAPEDVLSVYNSSRLTDICGIGRGIEKRLNNMGISTLIKLRLTPLSALIGEFGEVEGKFLKDIGMGIDTRPIVPYTEHVPIKSVSRNYCLPHNEYDRRKILQTVYELCEEVAIKLRRLHKTARTVGIYLGGTHSIHGRRTYSMYINTGKDIFEACLGTIDYHEVIDVRQISIWVSSLEDASASPAPLLHYDQKQQKLAKIIDTINDKFGDHTIRNGFLLYAQKLTTVPNGWLGDRYERTKLTVV